MLKKISLQATIVCLRLLNLCHYHWFELLEKFTAKPAWAKELSLYFHTSPQKIIQAYRQKRSQAANLWSAKKRHHLKQIFSFYSETDYWIYRQTCFNSHKAFLDIVLALLLKPAGQLCEYGAGVGSVTHWLIQYFPKWHYHLIDLDCPMLNFSRWRFRKNSQVSFGVVKSMTPPLKVNFDIILCKQVLEHIPNPLVVVKQFVKHLKPGGWLFIDYVNDPGQENLSISARQRQQVLTYLKTHLQAVFNINPCSSKEGYGLYIKN